MEVDRAGDLERRDLATTPSYFSVVDIVVSDVEVVQEIVVLQKVAATVAVVISVTVLAIVIAAI